MMDLEYVKQKVNDWSVEDLLELAEHCNTLADAILEKTRMVKNDG